MCQALVLFASQPQALSTKYRTKSNLAASCSLAQLQAMSSWTLPCDLTADSTNWDLQKVATVASVKRATANEGLLVNKRPMTLSIGRHGISIAQSTQERHCRRHSAEGTPVQD